MAQQLFHNPDQLINELNNNPFDINSVSQEKGKKTPSAFFDIDEGRRLVNMSPNDYFKFVSHQIQTTPDKLIANRQKNTNEISVDDMRKKMREGVKFDTPWLRLMDSGEPGTVNPYWQEGLHRMLAAGQEYGMDTKFPTYIAYENDPWNEIDTLSMDDFIKHYDNKRLERYNNRKNAELKEEEESKQWYKESAARHFNVPIDKVTPEQIKEYEKWEDSFFEDLDYDEFKDLLK